MTFVSGEVDIKYSSCKFIALDLCMIRGEQIKQEDAFLTLDVGLHRCTEGKIRYRNVHSKFC